MSALSDAKHEARAIFRRRDAWFAEPTVVSHPGTHAVVLAELVQDIPPPLDLNVIAAECHNDSYKWWHDEHGNRVERDKGTLLMLIVSEIAEAMEGERKGLMDDKLPHRPMAEVELVDALIRIGDYAAAYGYDLQGAYDEKRAYNAIRADHTHEARAQAGGKKF